MNQSIKLRPWVKLHPNNKYLQEYTSLTTLNQNDEPCGLMSIAQIQKHQLQLIYDFEVEQDDEDSITMAYISDIIEKGRGKYRIAFTPANKKAHQFSICLSEFIKQLAFVHITDASSGLHRSMNAMKQVQNYVIVNGKEIYEVGLGKSQIQLVQKFKTPLLNQLVVQEEKIQNIDIALLEQSFRASMPKWNLLLLGQHSWKYLTTSLQLHYDSLNILQSQFPTTTTAKSSKQSSPAKMLSCTELQLLHQDLLHKHPIQTTQQLSILKTVTHQLMQTIKLINDNRMRHHLQSLQLTLLNMQNKQGNDDFEESLVRDNLELYDIDREFSDFVRYPKERARLMQHIQQLGEESSLFRQEVRQLKQKVGVKNRQIKEMKEELDLYCLKITSLLPLEQQLQNTTEQLQSLKQNNLDLHSQIKSLQNTAKTTNLQISELQAKIEHELHQKKSLLQCLQQLTAQNLSLHSKHTTSSTQITQLKQQLLKNSQIQTRALNSIENQSQIKTRLYRYEQYVQQLKIGIKSYKRLESQKFNYILKHNFAEYERLKSSAQKMRQALKNEERKNKVLNDQLLHQKVRLHYFQKFLSGGGSYQLPIPQCSQENTQRSLEREQKQK